MNPDVTIVIPTCGRRSVVSAIRSALEQEGVSMNIEVIDASGTGAIEGIVREEFKGSDIPLRVTKAHGPLLPGAARSLGSEQAAGRWIAFLDDDDLFFPGHCRDQIDAARRHGAQLVTSDYVTVQHEEIGRILASQDGGVAASVGGLLARGVRGPSVRPGADEDLIQYMFERQSLRARKRIVFSSVLVDGELAKRVPWSSILRRFEDWDWLLRLEQAGAGWTHVASPLVAIGEGSPQSLSANTTRLDRAQRTWAIPLLIERSPRALGDLLACDVGVALAQSGDISGSVQMLRLARSAGRPGWQSLTRLGIAILGSLASLPAKAARGLVRNSG